MNKMHKYAPLLLVSVVLGACGGGGGGSSAPAPAPAPPSAPALTLSMNETNMQTVASDVLASPDITVFSQLGLAAGVIVQTQSQNQFSIKNFAITQIQEVLQEESVPITVAGIVTSSVKQCRTGSVNRSKDDADNNNIASTGDSVTLTFNNCVDVNNGVTFNGVLGINFTKIVGSATPGTNYDLGTKIAFNNLSIVFPPTATSPAVTFITNGSMAFTDTSVPGVEVYSALNIPSFAVTNGVDTTSYTNYSTTSRVNPSTTAYTRTLQGTYADSQLGGSISIVNTKPFQGKGASFPDLGEMKITAANASLTITAVNALNVKLDLDKGNDGSVELSQTVPWTSL